MLAFALFIAIFSSAVWLVYAINFVHSALSGMALADAGILNVLLYVLFICLPLFLVWAVFGFVSQYLYNRMTIKQLFKLFLQMRKSQEYSDLLARIMLETEQNIKDSFILNRFDLLIADMNELLSEFLQRERLVSVEQIEHLWTKVQNGGKWSFGKVLIENYNQQPHFQKRIFDDAGDDPLLAGTIMEFCARYQVLLSILEKHDKERMLLGIIETGVFGKVFAILAPVADGLHRTREVFGDEEKRPPLNDDDRTLSKPQELATAPNVVPPKKTLEKKLHSLFGKFRPVKNNPDTPAPRQKDAFSLALERSFGSEATKEEPPLKKQDAVEAAENIDALSSVAAPESADSLSADEAATNRLSSEFNSQKTLDSLKKEWQTFDQTTVSQSDDDLTYPFGGWTDAENYHK